jgi:hypothetical protein
MCRWEWGILVAVHQRDQARRSRCVPVCLRFHWQVGVGRRSCRRNPTLAMKRFAMEAPTFFAALIVVVCDERRRWRCVLCKFGCPIGVCCAHAPAIATAPSTRTVVEAGHHLNTPGETALRAYSCNISCAPSTVAPIVMTSLESHVDCSCCRVATEAQNFAAAKTDC